MSSKPASVPTWATSGTGIAATTDPGGTVRSNGWAAGDRPPSGWWNYMWHQTGLWLQYLSDGVITGDWTVTGDLITPNSDVLHGLRVTHYHPASMTAVLGFAQSGGSPYAQELAGTTNGTLILPIRLDVGQRLKEVRVTCQTDGSAALDFDCRLIKIDADGTGSHASATVTEIVGAVNGTVTTDIQQLALTPTVDTVDTFEAFCVRIHCPNSAGGKRVFRIDVDTDRVS